MPLAARLTAAETAYILDDSGARAVFCDQDQASVVQAAQASAAPEALLLCTGEAEGIAALDDALGRAGAALDDPGLDDPVEGLDMLYTSGTTGRPKGVKRPLSGDPLGSDRRRVDRSKALFDMDPQMVFLSPAPLYHAAPLRFAMTVLRIGGTVVLLEKFEPRAALAALDAHRVTHSQWVPTMFSRLLDLPVETRADVDLSAHRAAIHAGAPCPIPVKRAMIDWWGPILHEYYSGTESIGFTHVTAREWLERPGTVGRAWSCHIHIVGEDGRELGPNAVGTVYFSGGKPLTYHNAPDKTAQARHAAGWATMGDLGYVDADGYLFLTDRKAFTIVSGGVNVYPKEVEDVLMAVPGVRDAAVFGVPDPDLGEAVQAVVETGPETPAEAATVDRLMTYLRSHLAGFKCPRYIDFVDRLPRLDTGKVQKHALRDAYSDPARRGFATRECV